MPAAAHATSVAMPTAALALAAGHCGVFAGCAILFLQNDTSAHARGFAQMAETQRRQIN